MKTILQILELYRKKETTPYEIVSEYIKVIEEKEEIYNAFINIYKEEALDRAIELSKYSVDEFELYGIPIAIKDNIAVESMELTCGSRILLGFKSPYSATAVKRLLNQGAIIIGKTNLDEFGMGCSTEFSYFGPTKNAIDHSFVAGGSSGGSAVAVKLGEVPASLGSDTGGSIRQPSAFNGVVGLKPTYGRVSRYGLVAFASSLDQIGPIALNVKDLALIYRVISGYDPKDSTSVNIEVEKIEDIFINKRYKVGIPRDIITEDVEKEIKDGFEYAISKLVDIGHIVEDIKLEYWKYALSVYHIISSSEASSNLLRYDGIRYGYRGSSDNLWDLYIKTRSEGFGEEVKRRILIGTFCLSYGYYDEYYIKASKVRRLIKEEFMKAFKKVDVIITPTVPVFPWKLGEKLDDPIKMYLADVYTVLANLVGIPSISVPVKISKNGFPISIQIMGNYFREKDILDLAHQVEFNETS
ncbi:MAG: Asp-tRNA(Asn)/Glu-tRNA(Gln) amidotransferase subunit GatA [candidate division WOR-3 bacterium]|nr:Asp-tRNA(Asn)/Glu-tRNA(Gln) amidotransferase subunit GatA [candidate division WOR-3 bacterium]MCX7948029.1 Asp-tRNA(Asn)/Glu-tRNA(Gln) amidotransferase subunit GatA [candidate division WOR-3 bacterium]MDW8151074.1 Asp-tRNA(Asn)/Glu-tRNA(Gln) amidotransferase subunit GatA [candidate division WOR-3 bacterium]